MASLLPGSAVPPAGPMQQQSTTFSYSLQPQASLPGAEQQAKNSQAGPPSVGKGPESIKSAPTTTAAPVTAKALPAAAVSKHASKSKHKPEMAHIAKAPVSMASSAPHQSISMPHSAAATATGSKSSLRDYRRPKSAAIDASKVIPAAANNNMRQVPPPFAAKPLPSVTSTATSSIYSHLPKGLTITEISRPTTATAKAPAKPIVPSVTMTALGQPSLGPIPRLHMLPLASTSSSTGGGHPGLPNGLLRMATAFQPPSAAQQQQQTPPKLATKVLLLFIQLYS
jgi:hypothetical protein